MIASQTSLAVRSYAYTPVPEAFSADYAALTYPHFRQGLQAGIAAGEVVAIAAEDMGGPVGLALALKDHEAQMAELLSLFVIPDYRRQGIGTTLMQQLSTELRHQGCQRLTIRYPESPSSVALARILAKQQWTAPEAVALVCYASTDRVQQAQQPHLTQYLGRLATKLPPEYSLFLWTEPTADDRQTIMGQMATSATMQRFDPFIDAARLEPLNSLGLRCQDQVVGWIITHRIAPDTIRYTQMYVNPDSQPLSRSTLLLAKAIQLQVDRLPHTKGTFRVDMDNTPMVKFVQRRLQPYLDEMRLVWSAEKLLN
jgi:GNAT superfamily N-acetyltransferase